MNYSFLIYIGMACALCISAVGSGFGAGMASLASVGGWKKCYANGKRFGDWEMDTIVDSFGHAILTLTERSTNFILMEKLKQGRKAMPTAKTVAWLLFPYREHVLTITTDNGCEFAAHLEITRLLSIRGREKVTVFFADSYCSWQKGAIENANKLIRKYIPKKSNFDDFSDAKIMRIQKKSGGQEHKI